MNKVGGQWKAFCRYLQVKEEIIGIASANNQGNVYDAMMEALHKHSTSVPDPPFTWQRVLNALELLDLTEYAEKLKFAIFRGELDLLNRPECEYPPQKSSAAACEPPHLGATACQPLQSVDTARQPLQSGATPHEPPQSGTTHKQPLESDESTFSSKFRDNATVGKRLQGIAFI